MSVERVNESGPAEQTAPEGSIVSVVVQDADMDPAEKITSLDATWKPGDVVLDANAHILVRTDHPKWVWGYPNDGWTRTALGEPSFPDGALEDKDAPRPLTLLVRDGQAIGGRLIQE